MSTKPQAIGVLIRAEAAPPAGPLARRSTRLLAEWSAQQHRLVYCDLDGLRWREHQLLATGWSPCLDTDTWQPIEALALGAVYNRYPLQRAPQRLHELADRSLQQGLPFGNHPALQGLVRDKWRTQGQMTAAGLAMPDASLSPDDWLDALRGWRRAYLKPRYGAFGEGIFVLTWEADASEQGPAIAIEGPDAGQLQRCHPDGLMDALADACGIELGLAPGPSHVLQRAIAPPMASLRGFSIRSLVQQTPQGQWHTQARVARCSVDDPVANVARRATPQPLDDLCASPEDAALSPSLPGQLDQLDRRIAAALQAALPELPGHAIVEFGVDYLVDPSGAPWLLEINGFPQGRLAALAAQEPARFADKQRRALLQPLETLAHAMEKPQPSI